MRKLLLLSFLCLGLFSCGNKENSAKELIKQEWQDKNVELFLDEPYEMLRKENKPDNPLIRYVIIYKVRYNNTGDTVYYKASFDKDIKNIVNNTDSISDSEKQNIEILIKDNAEIDTLINLFNIL